MIQLAIWSVIPICVAYFTKYVTWIRPMLKSNAKVAATSQSSRLRSSAGHTHQTQRQQACADQHHPTNAEPSQVPSEKRRDEAADRVIDRGHQAHHGHARREALGHAAQQDAVHGEDETRRHKEREKGDDDDTRTLPAHC